ncbi:MAG: helix-turn-helix domain-containing protein [Thermoleophilia bacterium]
MTQNDVREQRLERGLSQAKLARALDLSRQTIHSIETGK